MTGHGPDIVLVSLGTTHGLRVADAALLSELRAAGATAEAAAVRIGALGRLRRGYPVNDLVEALAARRTLRSALEKRPRAVLLSTTTSAFLMRDPGVPYAVRLDSPARLNRPGLLSRPLHLLERRRLAAARLVLPTSEAARAALPPDAARTVVLPPPIEASGEPPARREPVAVAYVPDPKAKGLDVLCAAWAQAAIEGAVLAVYGLPRERALRHLSRTNVAEPPAVEWRGMATAAEFRAALRHSTAYVHAARWEDFGQAALEALADGALLATVPSGGAYEALGLARRLAPELVADDVSPGPLAAAIRAAFALPAERQREYRAEARGLLQRYRPEAVRRTLAEDVLPALLR